MVVMSDVLLLACYPDASHVDVPAVYVPALGFVGYKTLRVRAPLHDLNFGKADAFLIAACGGQAADHHELDQLLSLVGELFALRKLEAVFGRGNVLVGKRLEKDLQLVLPKFLFARLVEEGKVADMVHKDVAKDGQLRVFGLDLATVGSEGGAEAL
jgi:hypothetical protein